MIFIHLAEGFEEIEAITIADVLRRGMVDAKLVSMTEDKIVTGSHGIKVEADILFCNADYEGCQMIILPGGMPGTKKLGDNQKLIDIIIKFNNEGKWIGAICAAPMVLAIAGIIQGRKATIYPGMEQHLVKAEISVENVVVDGNVITSRGPGTAMDFSLKVLEIMKGKEISEKIRKGLILNEE